MAATFRRPPRTPRMRHFGGPTVWLEFTPLSKLTSSINLGQGSPGWAPPPFVTAALTRVAQLPAHSQYARPAGITELSSAVSDFYSARVIPRELRAAGKPRLDADAEVLVTNGASQAISLACSALLGAGDEIVLMEPAFDFYAGAAHLAGATPVPIALRPRKAKAVMESSADLELDLDALAAALGPRTRMLVINSPHNPTGKVFSREEQLAIARLVDERAPQCVVLSDEVYEHLVFDAGEGHVPFASVSPSAFSRTLSLYSSGKTFSATGLKVGWTIGPRELIAELTMAQQFTVFCVSNVGQAAVAEVLREAVQPYEGYPTFYDWLREDYRRKRDMLVDAVRGAGLHPIVPQGSFYVCATIPEDHPIRATPGLPKQIADYVRAGKLAIDDATVNRTDYNASRNLVVNHGVASIPVSAFVCKENLKTNQVAQNCVRFAFCHPEDVLSQAAVQLREGKPAS